MELDLLKEIAGLLKGLQVSAIVCILILGMIYQKLKKRK